MEIRKTRKDEYFITENLTREAFWNIYQPGCDEHYILHGFRQRGDFIPELDYVLEKDGKIIAHIMYCKAYLEDYHKQKSEVIMFGPISVSPAYQLKGFGSQIIQYTLDKAIALGYGAVVITGNPQYYHRFGFESCSKHHIYYEGLSKDDEASFFMVKELKENYLLNKEYTFKEPDGYKVNKADVEAYDRQFPKKIKEKRQNQIK